ncbi:hypothetical protein QBC40DRAFT_331921 [Triangularia verruculosa]|uniref:Heterokaryon incompatibility domain-containing protein n=1 Tax=Triangularia verruculosa TaxID=2587418 RepID=A0AAN6XCX0_9PEZI|nr:hypothetical protein QBC40DRAFT_331921 [Triangularia verruculosa]
MDENPAFDDYTVAWLCFDDCVETALLLMLDEEHGDIRISGEKGRDDAYRVQQCIYGRASGVGVIVCYCIPGAADVNFLGSLQWNFRKLELVIVVDVKSELPPQVDTTTIQPGDVTLFNISVGHTFSELHGASLHEPLQKINTEVDWLKTYRSPRFQLQGHGPKIIVCPDAQGLEQIYLADGRFLATISDYEDVGFIRILGFSRQCETEESSGYYAATSAACARHVSTQMVASNKLVPSFPDPSRSDRTLITITASITSGDQKRAQVTATEFTSRLLARIRQRFPGTFLWLLSSDEYQRWLHSTNRHTLVFSGDEGAGKSIATSVVIQDLHRRFGNDKTAGITYVYLDMISDQDQQTLFWCLVEQLMRNLSNSTASLPHLRADADLSYTLKILHETIAQFSRVWVIFDAIDKCSPERQGCLLDEIFKLQEDFGLKILITTSSSFSEITRRSKGCLHLAIRAKRADISRFVAGNLFRMPIPCRMDRKVTNRVIHEVVLWSRKNFKLAQQRVGLLAGAIEPSVVLCQPAASLPALEARGLVVAASVNAESVISAFANYGIDVNIVDTRGNTPLGWAAELGYENIARLLAADIRISIDRRNQQGQTPMLLASTFGHDKIVEILLQHGSNPNLKDQESVSPLWAAARAGHTAVVRHLLANELTNLNPRCRSYDHSYELPIIEDEYEFTTPLSITVWCGHTQIVALLLASDQVDRSLTLMGMGLVAFSLKYGHDEIAELLLQQSENGLSTLIGDQNVGTVLRRAAESGCARVLRLLLSKHQTDSNDDSLDPPALLMTAIQAAPGNKLVLQTLLSLEGVESYLCAAKGRETLIAAAAGGNVEAVNILLENMTLDPNIRFGSNRMTPVMMIARARSKALLGVFLVLAQKALDDFLVNANGFNILLHALVGRNWECVETLLETRLFELGHMLPRELPEQVPENLPDDRSDIHPGDLTSDLLNQPPGKDCWNNLYAGHTILSYLVARGCPPDMIKRLLVQHDVEINARGRSGNTLLMEAIKAGQWGTMNQILSIAGVDPNIPDVNGDTPLTAAIKSDRSKYESRRIISRLFGHELVNAATPDNDGRSPLSLAAERGLVKMVERLLTFDQVDPDSRDHEGRSPLSWTVYPTCDPRDTTADREVIAKRLLQTGRVDPNAEDNAGWNPLALAIREDLGDGILNLFLTRGDLDWRRVEKWGRIFLITSMGRREPDLARKIYGMLGFRYDDVKAVIEIPLSQATEEKQESDDESRNVELRRWIWWDHKTLLTLPTQRESDYDGVNVDDRGLCRGCEMIDLDKAFSRIQTQEADNGLLVAKLDDLPAAESQRSCGLCQLIADVSPSDKESAEDQGVFHLRAFSANFTWLCENQKSRFSDLPVSLTDTVFLAVVLFSAWKSNQGRNLLTGKNHVFESLMRSGFIGRMGSNCLRQERALTIQHIPSTGLDFGQIKGWIVECVERHSGACNTTSVNPIPHFRLIHCSTRKILSPTGAVPYTALSYVWGAVEDDGKELDTLDGHKLEAVVEDAIDVTLRLGYDYLWVDRYCIAQQHGSIKDEQLRNMSTVYQNAEVTLIAAAGEDATFGLPGVGQRLREPRPVVKVQGHILTSIPPDPSRIIKSSKWATRGWTYQEGLLSRRRLFFTQHEVSFECGELLAREAIKLPTIFSVSKPQVFPPRSSSWFIPPGSVFDKREAGLGVHELISGYMQRDLTYESDVLNAMLGIFHVYTTITPQPLYHLCGILIVTVNKGPDRQHNQVLLRGSDDEKTNLAAFIRGLLWTSAPTGRRRADFPSWSWTGWQGISTLDPRYGFATSHPVDISIVEPRKPGPPLAWSDYTKLSGEEKQTRFSHYHVLQMEGLVVQVSLRSTDSRINYSGWDVRYQAILELGDDVLVGDFWPTKQCDVSANGRLLTDSWMGVFMTAEKVLVVEEQADGLWERIGVADFWNSMRHYEDKPDGWYGLEKRTILLG